ncbi:Killer protein [Acinetobacter sp. ANC 4779]|uniref:type II toxin-antitoxin system RelE/ParE family toxin n=1 Tax=Acinetobacter sp. ANC 4779 TaxID=2529848 RepID=UPI00103BC824|nr:type II toxin-antitoxin system RelE/ParE family toxin [Acinetobacter sp. ANC 4779]TCB47010.1 Killer protein [Acinetobacter sp. ANC 4779]
MIVDFNHKGLERFFKTSSTAGIRSVHSTKLKRQLTALNEAQSIDEMNFPGWKLHPLKGKLKDHWAITVNANWRMTFIFKDGNAYIVDYQDYH